MDEIVKVLESPKYFPIAFALVEKGKGMLYRRIRAVKTSSLEAVLIPSGKLVTIAADKMVWIKP